jgi:two-component system phosphate regulon sensor histidine kinase PhoR
MAQRRFSWQLFSSFLIVTLVILGAIGWYASSATGGFYRDQTAKDLAARARLIEQEVLTLVLSGAGETVDAFCDDRGERAATRITVIRPDGLVVGDSDEDPAVMENHADRPEIREAFEGGVGTSVRYSRTLRQNMMYVAIPLKDGAAVRGVLRTSMPLAHIGGELATVYSRMAIGGVVVAVLAALLCLANARRFTRPVEEMTAEAQRLARGDRRSKVRLLDTKELGTLAESINQMAEQLDAYNRTIKEQRNEEETILASMLEGVIAVDAEERIISVNQAACRLLAVEAEKAHGRVIHEVVRNTAFLETVESALRSSTTVERDAVLHGEEERLLKVRATARHGAEGEDAGAVIVLNDVTRLRRLEGIRRDVVANVSRELEAPVAAITGCTEAIRKGGVGLPEEVTRSLKALDQETERLKVIIHDLGLLAALDRQDEKAVERTETAVREVLERAVAFHETNARDTGIEVVLECDPGLRVRLNAPLLEQAVRHLIGNALAHSPAQTEIKVAAGVTGNEIYVTVRDEGCGIEQRHMPRIFERFYRVGDSRLEAAGGAGLGLAIVKHVVDIHGGRVIADSRPGAGSTFAIRLPRE